MRILKVLKQYVPRLLRKLDRTFRVSVEKQKKYLQTFEEPETLVERSYNQYLCQRIFWGKIYYFFANFVSLFLVQLQKRKMKEAGLVEPEKKVKLLLVAGQMSEHIFPEILLDEYKSYQNVKSIEGFYWNQEDVNFYQEVLQPYKRSPFFIYKCMMKMGGYSYLIQKYHPNAIAVCGCECSYTSSFLTQYCRCRGIKHYNVMHGEMFYYILDSFSVFDRFYVWDSYYIRLQKKLRAFSDQYIVALPPSVKIDFEKVKGGKAKKADYKYYLQLQSPKTMKKIADVLERLRGLGYRVVVRPHPRTTDFKSIYKIFPKQYVEEPKDCSLEQSMKQTKGVIALHSTVLFQAYYSEKIYIIDDVTQKKKFRKLKKLQYIMLRKEPGYLSSLIKERN